MSSFQLAKIQQKPLLQITSCYSSQIEGEQVVMNIPHTLPQLVLTKNTRFCCTYGHGKECNTKLTTYLFLYTARDIKSMTSVIVSKNMGQHYLMELLHSLLIYQTGPYRVDHVSHRFQPTNIFFH